MRTAFKTIVISSAISLFSFNHAFASELRAAFVETCPTTKFPEEDGKTESPILTAIAVSVASSLVDTGIAALKKAVNPENKVVEGRFLEQGMYMYRNYTDDKGKKFDAVKPAHKLGCLVVAVGEFSDDGRASDTSLPFPTERDDGEPSRLVGAALKLGGKFKLSYYMEAARVFSGDQSAVTWKPVRLYTGEYLNESFWAGSSRSAVMQINFYSPGNKEAFFTQDFAFNEVKKPLNKGPGELKNGMLGSWGVLPAATPLMKGFEPTDDGHLFNPFTLEVRLIEAPKPYAIAQIFIDGVEKNKESIKNQVTQAIDKDYKAKATFSANDATSALVTAYAGSLDATTTACTTEKKADPEGIFKCSIARSDANSARDKAQLACKSNPISSCADMPPVPSA